MLVGGYAVGFHGYGRTTNDIDIFVANDQKNAESIVAALSDFGFGVNELSADLFTRKDSLVVLGVEPFSVDILNYLTGVNFEDAYGRRKIVTSENIEISLISLDDLVENKRATGRYKDLADIEYLERINSGL